MPAAETLDRMVEMRQAPRDWAAAGVAALNRPHSMQAASAAIPVLV